MAVAEDAEVEVQDVDDEDSAAESCLARKVASFGMASRHDYTPRRIQSEQESTIAEDPSLPHAWLFGHYTNPFHFDFTVL
jgi:hypothetical protein